MRFHAAVCYFLAAAGLQAQERTLLTVAAWGAAGASGNRWNTEVYVTNLTAQAAEVVLAQVLPLKLKSGPHPCLPPVGPFRVEGLSTRVVLASELNLWLGCPEEFVGGLLFEHPPGILVASRMTNVKGFAGDPGSRPLQGYSQEIAGLSLSQLPGGDGRFMIPSLAWQPGNCPGGREYDAYLYLANPDERDLSVRLLPRPGTTLSFRLGDVDVELPYTVKVPGRRVVQVALVPAQAAGSECAPPEFFDLLFEADGKLGVLASVVDRASNDARTVLVTAGYRVAEP